MPRRPVVLPADRFFARLDKFECECPSCGSIIFAGRTPRTRSAARLQPDSPSVWKLTYNPNSQRLRCPHCNLTYIVGLLAYPVPHHRRSLEAPPDTVPTSRQWMEMRKQGGGWFVRKAYTLGEEVNLVVDSPCSCGPKSWAPTCPIHGDPAHGGGQLTAEAETGPANTRGGG